MNATMSYQTQPQSPQAYVPYPERPRQHSRTRSGFSFTSNKSGKSDMSIGSKPKVDSLVETEADKQRQRFNGKTKANPNTAMNEAQPIVQAQEANTMTPLRSMQLKDLHGNVIVDPDASNPTRSRMERPLDTIRSFQAAIDSGYKKREYVPRTESADAVPPSRRDSYERGHETPINRRQSPGHYDPRHARQPTYDPGYHQGQNGYMQRQRPRGQGAPHPVQPTNSDYGVYNHTHQDSNDTFQTGYSSGSQSEQWANSTDPTSDSGSVDRTQGFRNGDAYDAYGGEQWKGSPIDSAIVEENGYSRGYYPPNGQQKVQQQRAPIKLGNQYAPPQPLAESQKPLPSHPQDDYYPPSQQGYYGSSQGAGVSGGYGQQPNSNTPFARRGGPPPSTLQKALPRVADEKRKSWLKRRFSKE